MRQKLNQNPHFKKTSLNKAIFLFRKKTRLTKEKLSLRQKLNQKMVHKKYIKRGGKTFGPYLYENYRENGATKTRYLGRPGTKKTKGSDRLYLGLGIFLLLLIAFSFVALFLLEKDFFSIEKPDEELSSYSPLNFLKNLFFASPLNVFVTIVDNYLPEIFNLPLNLEACENEYLEDYSFYIQDLNGREDIDSIRLTPLQPFYLDFYNYPFLNITNATLWSQELVKKYVNSKRYLNNGWAVWKETVIVTDGEGVVSQGVNITIIEVNNPPKFNVSVETILSDDLLYTIGDDRVFYYDLGSYLVTQLEETSTLDLVFNLTYVNGSLSPFNIDSNGVINITGNNSLIPEGNESWSYYLNLSVYDTGLSMRTSLHPNKTECYGPEYNEDPRSWSDAFWLTITKKNRAPIINSHYPLVFNLSISGADNLYFNLTARDPDYTPLDVYWYVDGIIKKSMRGLKEENVSEFEYLFNCGVGGEHKLKALVTDGLANDSIEFNLSVAVVGCSVPPSGGGGGGGGRVFCEEKWGCEEWMQCQNLINLSESGWASKETELLIKERCGFFNWEEEFCGFQQKICQDFNFCNTENKKPPTIRECYYTENPTCNDGIKNCHEDDCEYLVDCGGPCEACPTCNDGKLNQGEQYEDCGGPCKPCETGNPATPKLIKSVILYSLFILLMLVLFLVTKQTIKYYKGKKTFQTSKIKNKFIRKGVEEFDKRTVLKSLFFIGFVIVLLSLSNIFIIRFSQTNPIITDISDVFGGTMASYGLINSFFKNFGLFFISDVLINPNSKIMLWDDTNDLGGEKFTLCIDAYCVEKNKPSSIVWTTKFYANYTDLNSQPLGISSGAVCKIQFQNSESSYENNWQPMSYNIGTGFWEYTANFNYQGNYNFQTNCTFNSISNIAEDDFLIKNTVPYLLFETAQGYWDLDRDGVKNSLLCIEDRVCYYDFSKNVTEDDTNDDLIFGAVDSGVNPLKHYLMNPITGILEVNITKSIDTGNAKTIKLSVEDSEETVSTILEVDVQEINDAPIFNNLENKTMIIDELFIYNITITDEELSAPFVFNVSFITCYAPARNNCTLLREGIEYTQDKAKGILSINFIPNINDIGVYEVNLSVMDYNLSLGNSTKSKSINFTVTFPIWTFPLETNAFFNEGDFFYLNLSKNVSETLGEVSFSNGTAFPSFNMNSDGIISFIPDDKDVGNWLINIFAINHEIVSFKTFNFTIYNKNDSLYLPLYSLQADNAVVNFNTSKVEAYENANVRIFLFVEDNDLAISASQKARFYDERINLSLNIEGPNPNLFNFVFNSVVQGNKSMHVAEFIPLTGDEGEYNISINITDANRFSNASFNFALKIIDRSYTIPNITFPDESIEFNFKEGVPTNLIFRANHSAQEESLIYEVYINDTLRDVFFGAGDNSDVPWSFTPNFTDETYGNKTNLTLIVKNQNVYIKGYSDLWDSRTWNLTINHTNSPVEFIVDEIFNKTYPINFAVQINLKDYFLDVDHEDSHYNQKVDFDIFSDAGIFISPVSNNWTFLVSSASPLIARLNITASDLNLSNESIILTSAMSNNFQIEFVPDDPKIVIVYVPTSGGGSSGSSSSKIISLKILTPGGISVYEGEKIDIPFQLINTGAVSFNDLVLNSSAFKQGEEISELKTSLDMISLNALGPGEQKNLSLSVFFESQEPGEYEILVSVESKYPRYKDWGKIHIELQAINESQIRELLVFTEEFITQNPQCIEITEIIKEAEEFLQLGDYVTANLRTRSALESCKNAISQVSVPKTKIKYFNASLILGLTIFIALFLGLIYYFVKRRKIQNTINAQKIKEETTKRF